MAVQIESLRVSSSFFDHALYRDAFTTDAMRAVFSDARQIKAYIEAEVALAQAQGETGVIPVTAAHEIAAKAFGVALDLDQLKRDTDNVGYPIVGLVKQLSAKLDDAGRYLHWGATTQDIMDTATVIQLKEAVGLIERQLATVMDQTARLAAEHRDTPMPGRTHLQQALPITFGHKTAIWLSSLQRSAERLQEAKPRMLVAQLGGAAGTLASLGDRGLDVRAAYARALGLHEPAISWHVAREGLVEAAQIAATICGSLGKIGFDVMFLMATEVGEVFEPFSSHRGASSTMPQKRNPISSELLIAHAKFARSASALMLDGAVSDLERATGPWHAEWVALPQCFMLAAGALHQAEFMLSGLVVDRERMRANLDASGGLIVAEAVMMGLATFIGRQQAHDVVYAACREAIGSKDKLSAVLLRQNVIRANVPEDVLLNLCEPVNYLGTAGLMVDRVLADHSARRRKASH
jgi:3-carboxy-cis,cis-muconate cycloisomerase